jgi:hypothetical protein
MTDAQFLAITRALWPVTDTASARVKTNHVRRETSLLHLFTDADTTKAIRGTRWAGYQAVTEYADHYAPVDGKRDAATVRAERVVSGTVADLKHRAFDLLAI